MKIAIIGFIVLSAIGAINWGLVGAFNFNLVEALFGQTYITRIIYILVGLSGLGLIVLIKAIINAYSKTKV